MTGQTSLDHRPGLLNRNFPLTDMPTWLMLALVALGLPRTFLEDLDIVAPESGLLYFILALTPFAVWLVVAVVRRSRKPFMDFLVLGVLYGLSLAVVHQALWSVASSLGHRLPRRCQLCRAVQPGLVRAGPSRVHGGDCPDDRDRHRAGRCPGRRGGPEVAASKGDRAPG